MQLFQMQGLQFLSKGVGGEPTSRIGWYIPTIRDTREGDRPPIVD